MRPRSVVKLSVGASPARRIVAAGCGIPSLLVAGMVLWLISDLLSKSVTMRPFDLWGELLPNLLAAAIGLVGVYVTGAVAYLMLRITRYAGFLDGTRLAERRVWRRQWLDLATATIDATYDPSRGGVRLLIARSPEGAEVRLPLTQGPVAIPPAELTALADAITSNRMPSGDDDRAFEVAEQLPQLAGANQRHHE